jgi:hypothetical protein
MRDLTAQEHFKLLETGRCPYCTRKVFRFGPRGAASLNIFCEGCGAGFNICVPVGLPAQLIREPAADRTGMVGKKH